MTGSRRTEGAGAGGSPARTPPARDLARHHDGSLYDTARQCPVALAELAEDVRGGGSFRARDAATGRDCTYRVLAAVLAQEVAWGAGMPGRNGLSALRAAVSAVRPPAPG
ncbi:polyhydroxyalkanoate synthesis regulator DNA-binding domain-containing protein [Streptomyces mobaraensis]|uniref:polyhydroxyalkanoate synthesis regulator DNA-binding domain-containing protein n=1 Tax=Streptomyces mobaraensis TaxID=35621 RepID=UPI00332B572E